MRRSSFLVLTAAPLLATALGCHGGAAPAPRAAVPPVPAPLDAADASGSERVLLDQMRRMAVEDAAARR